MAAIAVLVLLVGAKASAWSQMKSAAVVKRNRIFMVDEDWFVDFCTWNDEVWSGERIPLEGSFRCSKLNSEFEVLKKGIFGVVLG